MRKAQETCHLEAQIEAVADETKRVEKRGAALGRREEAAHLRLEEARDAKGARRSARRTSSRRRLGRAPARDFEARGGQARALEEAAAEGLSAGGRRGPQARDARGDRTRARGARARKREPERRRRELVRDGDFSEGIKGDYHEAMEAWAASHDAFLAQAPRAPASATAALAKKEHGAPVGRGGAARDAVDDLEASLEKYAESGTKRTTTRTAPSLEPDSTSAR